MSKPVCIFQSPIWTRSGYGDLGMTIAKSLVRYDKFEVHLVPTRWGGCSRKFLGEHISDPEEQQLFSKVLRQPLQKQPEIFIQCSIPNEFQPVGKYNIGITAGIETTMTRLDWIEGLNRMNLNLVTSAHAKTVFDEADFKKETQGQPTVQIKNIKPMEILFFGADTRIYKKTNNILPTVEVELNKIEEDFCFLFVGQWTHGDLFSDRKDIGNLIRVFMETFKDQGAKPKPALIVKTSGAAICNMDKYEMINRLKAIKVHIENQLQTKDIPNVYLLHGDLTEMEMNSLYNHPKVKAHVSFTHGEGFGHPLLLSTLSGKPLYVSNWSGHLDFLAPSMANLLDGKVDKIAPSCVNEWLIADSSWFTVDYPKAADKLRESFYYYNNTLAKAEQLRAYNAEHFSTVAMDTKLHAMLDKYVPKFAIETKLVLPKLKKIGLTGVQSANSQSVDASPSSIKLPTLPKLKKIALVTSPTSSI
jgi:hypothetical protein